MSAMHKVIEKLKEEFFAVLPPTIFSSWLYISWRLFALMLKGTGISPLSRISFWERPC
jgi:hypothetical protein